MRRPRLDLLDLAVWLAVLGLIGKGVLHVVELIDWHALKRPLREA